MILTRQAVIAHLNKLTMAEITTRYLGYVREIAERWLDRRTLEPLVRGASRPRRGREACTRKLYTYAQLEAGVQELEEFVERRRAFLLDALR